MIEPRYLRSFEKASVENDLLLLPRHDPLVDLALVIVAGVAKDFLGLGARHVEGVRDDTGAGLELGQLGHQFYIQARQQVERDDGGFAEVEFENVRVLDRHEFLDFVLLAFAAQIQYC